MARGATVGQATARQLQTLLRLGTAGNLSDCELLARFVARGDSEAFALLVERHGPMVLRVCQDVLGDGHDAHDAFQATFLVLIRRAGSIRKRRSLGSWLHGVARRVSRKLRGASARRRLIEVRAAQWRAQEFETDLQARRRVEGLELHEEIGRLPEKYRTPIVLCYLEGLSHTEAAARLDWPVGTVRGRLARARERLRSRLEHCGLAPPPASVLILSSPEVPAHLTRSVVNLVLVGSQFAATRGIVPASLAALAEGAMQPMSISKATIMAAAVTLGGALASGAAWMSKGERSAKATPPIQVTAAAPQATAPGPAQEVLNRRHSGPIAHGWVHADLDNDGVLDLFFSGPGGDYTALQDCRSCHASPVPALTLRTQTRHAATDKAQQASPFRFHDVVVDPETIATDRRTESGDMLRLRLKLGNREPEVSEHVVGPLGEISLASPLGLTFRVRGLTAREAKRQIIQELRRNLNLSDLDLSLVKVEDGRAVAVDPGESPAVEVEIVPAGGVSERSEVSIDQRLRRQEERLQSLESKLDRVLEAIEKQAARTR